MKGKGLKEGDEQVCGEHLGGMVATRRHYFLIALGDSGIICPFYRLVEKHGSGVWGVLQGL